MIHIQRFVERLQGFDARGAKDFIMSVKDAKELHADITKLLLALESSRSDKPADNDDTITIEMHGGSY